jgi:hypothetical protein
MGQASSGALPNTFILQNGDCGIVESFDYPCPNDAPALNSRWDELKTVINANLENMVPHYQKVQAGLMSVIIGIWLCIYFLVPYLGIDLGEIAKQIGGVAPFLLVGLFVGSQGYIVNKRNECDKIIRDHVTTLNQTLSSSGVQVNYLTRHTQLCKPKSAKVFRAIQINVITAEKQPQPVMQLQPGMQPQPGVYPPQQTFPQPPQQQQAYPPPQQQGYPPQQQQGYPQQQQPQQGYPPQQPGYPLQPQQPQQGYLPGYPEQGASAYPSAYPETPAYPS